MRWAVRIGLVLVAVAALSSCHKNGETFVVTVTDDTVDVSPGDGFCGDVSQQCSLRAAVMEANALPGVDEIVIKDEKVYPLTIAGTGEDAAATGDLDITEGVDLIGNGTIDADSIDRALDLHTSGLVFIDGPDLVNGLAPDGAALRTVGGTVTLQNSNLTGNVATTTAPIDVSGGLFLYWYGTASENVGATGGVLDTSAGVASVIATLSDNTGGSAGAIEVSGGSLKMEYSTVVGNTGAPVAGLNVSSGNAGVGRSIVADPVVGANCSGSFISLGYNLESGTSCGFTESTDLQDRDPMLGALADNGGGSLTHHPVPGSPVLEQIPLVDCSVVTDVRGVTRPAASACDIGAVEVRGSTVDHAGDGNDDDPGDGVCQDVSGGQCSLRAAIEEANATPGPDVLALDDDPLLTVAGAGEDASASGDLDISSDLTIVGNGHTIAQTTTDRVIDVLGTAEVVLDPLVITGGDVTGDGGGLRVAASASVVLDEATVTTNSATGNGGGVLNMGELVVADSTISSNLADWAGAIANLGAGDLTITHSTISGNDAEQVGGLWHASSVAASIGDSTFAGNVAVGNGGAVFSEGATTVERTVFHDNEAEGDSALPIDGQGGAWFGGSASEDDFVNVTFSGNIAQADGGAIFTFQADTTLTYVTMTENVSLTGALVAWSPSSLIVYGSIIADQSAGADCGVGPATSIGYNIESASTCGFTDTGDLQFGSPLLGSLTDNGGPTVTHLPASGSPAVGRIPNGKAVLCDGTIPTDQRGISRPQVTTCDVGAVER